jgi:hypothetical protein
VASEFGDRRFVRAVTHDRVSTNFPTGEIPTRARRDLASTHRVSEFCETRIQVFRTHDTARSDIPIRQREITERASCGCRKVPIRD